MAIIPFWDNPEKTILRYDVDDKDWTWTDFQAAHQSANCLMSEVDHPVHTIINVSNLSMPQGVFWQMKHIKANRHPNRGLTVLVGPNLFVDNMIGVFESLYPTGTERLRRADTLEDARELLNRAVIIG